MLCSLRVFAQHHHYYECAYPSRKRKETLYYCWCDDASIFAQDVARKSTSAGINRCLNYPNELETLPLTGMFAVLNDFAVYFKLFAISVIPKWWVIGLDRKLFIFTVDGHWVIPDVTASKPKWCKNGNR